MNGVWGRPSRGGGAHQVWQKANQEQRKWGDKGESQAVEAFSRYQDRCAILHNVKIPGSTANIDHITVSGNEVTLWDSKWWSAGSYWTLGSMSFKGLRRRKDLEKLTLVKGRAKIEAYLRAEGVHARFRQSRLIVWGRGPHRHFFFRFPGASWVSGAAGVRRAMKVNRQPASDEIVSALRRLLVK